MSEKPTGNRPGICDRGYLRAAAAGPSRPGRRYLCSLAILALLGFGHCEYARHYALAQQVQTESLSSTEFSRIVREFSEDEGFFRSDNFVSNETSYLHVVDKLRALGRTGGAYIGVGPEQNFTYIAKTRPRIAFIVDIRRQAMIQHLMLKSLFHLAADRTGFLSLLFSKPARGPEAPGPNADAEGLLEYFRRAEGSQEYFDSNLAKIRKSIEEDFAFPLNARDLAGLEYIYASFRDENLSIQYRSGSGNWASPQWGGFPTLQELVLEADLGGKRGNFLAHQADYEFVRNMQVRNRIIPVVGNFAGAKALAAVGEYLSKNGYTVATFYTSNVEQYLFANGVFDAFVENVRKLPLDDKSLFIRAFPNMREPHPARIPGHRLTTLLQRMEVFLQDYDKGLYRDYWGLVTTNFISANEP